LQASEGFQKQIAHFFFLPWTVRMTGTPRTPTRGQKKLITAYVQPAAAEEVLNRSERLGWSLAKTAGAIIEQWHAMGCPSLTDLESLASKKRKS
jgi:hypothetical protein